MQAAQGISRPLPVKMVRVPELFLLSVPSVRSCKIRSDTAFFRALCVLLRQFPFLRPKSKKSVGAGELGTQRTASVPILHQLLQLGLKTVARARAICYDQRFCSLRLVELRSPLTLTSFTTRLCSITYVNNKLSTHQRSTLNQISVGSRKVYGRCTEGGGRSWKVLEGNPKNR